MLSLSLSLTTPIEKKYSLEYQWSLCVSNETGSQWVTNTIQLQQ